MDWNAIWNFLNVLNEPWLISICKIIIIAVSGFLVIRLVGVGLNKMLGKSKLDKAAHGLIKTVVKTLLWVVFCLVLAASLGIDVTGIVALASVATLAISLALQNMLTNVIGGFTLLYTDPFNAGDYVEIDGQGGTVEDVGIAYTRLITPDNKIIYIPNSTMLTANVINYSTNGSRRMDINISASYDCAPDAVMAALIETTKGENYLQDNPPAARVAEYGDHAISYTLRIWAKNEDYWTIHQNVMQKIYVVFKEKGIEMTYPHLNVHLDK